MSLGSMDDNELNCFTITNTTKVFLWVVLDDGILVHEDVFICVTPGDETVTILDVEPLHCSSDDVV